MRAAIVCEVLLLIICFLCTSFGLYSSQPKLLNENGHLIIESAKDRNISIRLAGGGCLLVNGLDILKYVQEKMAENSLDVPKSQISLKQQIDDLINFINGPNGLVQRIQRVENRTSTQSPAIISNFRRRLKILTEQIATLDRKLREDDCKQNPCKNGGTCMDLFEDFRCQCPMNWEGKTCEIDVNECYQFAGTDLGCQNSGLCINMPGSYRCECTTGWKGIHCMQRTADCLKSAPGELCGNGVCVPKNDDFGYTCICNQGWKSNNITPACTVDVDECAEKTHPCISSCINLPGHFMCGPCPSGYSGDGRTCTDINECEINNGGCSTEPSVRCINTQGSYHCGNCPIGWSGDGRICTRDPTSCNSFGICHPEATCRYVSNSIICTCPPGTTGNGYGPTGCTPMSLEPCKPNPCKNGGTCHPHGSSYICTCSPGYEELNCAKRNLCQNNPCKNGGTCIPTVSSYRCICEKAFEGPNCEEDRKLCGTIVRQLSGQIQYPSSTGNYKPGERCAWVIRTTPEYVLNVTFTKFDVERHTECHKDFLQIHDGRSAASQIIGRFCGTSLPKGGNFTSSHNQLYFWFRSDDSIEKGGFELSWNSIAPFCGGRLSIESNGVIHSPGYPGKSPPNRDCEWILEASPDKRIRLTFYEVYVTRSTSCNGDFLEILDGETDRQELTKICEHTLPTPVQSISNTLIVHFHTDDTNFDSSFQLHYETVPGINMCGGYFTEYQGSFESPKVRDYVGSTNYTCKYLIRTDPTVNVKLDFTEFNLGIFPDCSFRSVEVFDGKTENDPLIGRWCGNTAPDTLMSSSNHLLIIYRFTSFLNYERFGFRANYRIGCDRLYREPTGIISSPLYPKKFISNLRCVYTIEAPEGYAISVEMNDFQLLSDWWTPHSNCNNADHLMVYSPDLRNSSFLGQYCKAFPEVLISKYNRMVLVFTSNSEIELKGFQAKYSIQELGCGGVTTDKNGTVKFEYDGRNSTKMECEWIFLAPKNNHIYLKFEKFNIGNGSDCSQHFVKIIGDNITSTKNIGGNHVIQDSLVFCGSKLPLAGTYPTNILTLSFYADSLNPNEEFLASYRFVNMHTDCNAEYISSYGMINSPGWPGQYYQNLNCVWIIHAPKGQQIELNVKSFYTERNSHCDWDYLEVRDGITGESPLIGRYCGDEIPKKIISYTNNLYINFNTDDSIEEPGFSIEWDRASVGCGGILNSIEGFILPPHFPEVINNGVQCDWHLMVNYGSTISVNVTAFTATATTTTNDDCEIGYLSIFDGPTTLSDKLSPNCTRELVRLYESTQNSILVRYQAINDDGSFQLKYQYNCVVELHEPRGVIESPNFPHTYPDNLECEWKIMSRKGNNISLAFSHLDMEKQYNECVYDELKVIDYKDGEIQKEHKICTLSDTGVITGTGDTMKIRLSTDFAIGGSGFRLEYQITGCIRYFTHPSGIFASPNFPYSVDIFCEWTINAGYGNVVELNIIQLEIESETDCSRNAITVSSHKSDNSTLLKLCSTETGNHVITSSGHMMYIKFYTDSIKERKFVKATYLIKRSVCGGQYHSANGFVHSQNFPKKYPKNTYCEWVISAGKDHTLDLSFNMFDLANSTNCEKDYVELYDGSEKAPSRLLLRHCGPSLPSPNSIESVEHEVLLIFKSSADTDPGFGFDLQYKRNCGKDIVDQSDGYFVKAITDKNCIWTIISTNASSHVTLHFEHIQCECDARNPNECESEKGIQVFDGESIESPLKISFCIHHPPTIISNGQSLTIKAISGYFEAYYSLYENSCGGKLSSLRGKFATPRYPNSYPSNIECIWEISAESGSFIEISFDVLKISKSDHCNEDYLEIREKGSDGKLLGIFCGNDLPSSSVKGFEKIWVKFRSDEDGVGDGFLATWSYVHDNVISGNEGKIKSPPIRSIRNEPDDYSWRIIAPRENVISLVFQEYGEGLNVYDGFDQTAEQIDIETEEFFSSANVAYITAESSNLDPFVIKWKAVPKNESVGQLYSNSTCFNRTMVIPMNEYINITSPGYPFGYADDLHCEWILKTADPATHVVLMLYEANLESASDCAFDYLSLYSSQNFIDWELKGKFCDKPKRPWPFATISGTPFLKVVFHTDVNNNNTGFEGRATTACGSHMTASEGTIKSITATDTDTGITSRDCSWSIHVKAGKRIKFTFKTMEIPTTEDARVCDGYVSIRNGYDEHAPFLGIGAYCKGKNLTVPESSTNRAFVRSFTSHNSDMEWELIYTSVSDSCDETIHLTKDQNSTNITTPNYPDVPSPHSECVWVILGPPGESLQVTFPDHFDLYPRWDCKDEYVEIRDGSTSVSNLIKKFCIRPHLLRSTGNALYIKYFSDAPEPRNGFKAQITFGKCGGKYIYPTNREITSENYPATGGYPSYSVCEYYISVSRFQRINITLLDIHLPVLANRSGSDHLTFYNLDETENNSTTEIGTVYGDNTAPYMEFENNRILIKFFSYAPNAEYRGFKLGLRPIVGKCGKRIIAESGEIIIPNLRNTLRTFGNTLCFWHIVVPKGRRIRVDVMEYEVTKGNNSDYTLSFYNDFGKKSKIAFYRKMEDVQTVYSSDNLMVISLTRGLNHGFSLTAKLNFSSYELSFCPLDITDESGTFTLPNITTTYFCTTKISVNPKQTFVLNVEDLQVESTTFNFQALVIKARVFEIFQLFAENVTSAVVPISVPTASFQILQNNVIKIKNLRMSYKRYECGGSFPVQGNSIITKPNITNSGSIDCAWYLRSNVKYNLAINFSFPQDCDKEYLIVYNGPTLSHVQIGKYCKNTTQNLVEIIKRGTYIHYHSETTNYANSRFEISVTPSVNCGGEITNLYGMLPNIEFSSKDYRNNMECVWDIKSKFGFSTEFSFFGRFYIEESADCTKDYIQIRVFNDNMWTSYPQLCGRNIPNAINVTSSKMQVIFRSDNNTVGDGFNIRLRVICGGTYIAKEIAQQITFQAWEYYSYLLQCNYTLVSTTKDIISVYFRELDLDNSKWCQNSRMTVYKEDQYNEEMSEVGSYCTMDFLKDIRGRNRIMLIVNATYMRAPHYSFGFKLEPCGGIITNATTIHSPKHETEEGSYADNMECVWNITAPNDMGIIIEFKLFEMLGYYECTTDYVKIYAGSEETEANEKYHLCGEYGKKGRPVVKILQNKAIIVAKTDEYGSNGRGFMANIKFSKLCDEDIKLTEENPSYDFNRFNGNYENNLDCHYTFTAPGGYFVQIDFHSFNLSSCSGTLECNCDYIEIRYGLSHSSEIVDTFCGEKRPSRILSTRQKIHVRFVTDSNDTAQGFHAAVRLTPSQCGNSEINLNSNKEIIIESPNFGNLYPANVICYWTITSNSSLELHFDKFDLEEPDETGSCRDFFEITYDPLFSPRQEDDFREHEILCGNRTPNNHFVGATKRNIELTFKTNAEVERSGFKAVVRQGRHCNVTYTALSGRILKGNTKTDCNIYFNMPENYTISFHFSYYYELSGNCTKSFFKFYDENTNKLLQAVCSYTTGVFLNSNRVKLQMVLPSAITVDITYIASNLGLGCGGNLYQMQGTFSSPLYPNNDGNYTNCRWNIQLPRGVKIYLYFVEFDMGSSATCTYNYVKFLEPSKSGELKEVRKFCGTDQPETFTSEQNQLTIVYNKTLNFEGTGWSIRYNGQR